MNLDEDIELPYIDEDLVQKERAKAKELRKTSWWKKKRSSGECYYCKKKVRPDHLTMDHLIPLNRGGKSVKENLVACCKECNNEKKYMMPWEWLEHLEQNRKSAE